MKFNRYLSRVVVTSLISAIILSGSKSSAEEADWLLGMGLSILGKPVELSSSSSWGSVSVLAERKFSNLLGLRGSLGVIMGGTDQTTPSGDNRYAGVGAKASLPVYYEGFFIAPVFGTHSLKSQCKSPTGCNETTYSQTHLGAQLGYQFVFDIGFAEVSLERVNYSDAGSVTGASATNVVFAGGYAF